MGKILQKKSAIEQIKESSKKPAKEIIPDESGYKGLLIPSGAKMLNLACSDKLIGAFALGKIINIIGDSSSGKTLLELSMLSEIANIPAFDDYDLFLDDAENALTFNIKKLFGSVLDERLRLDKKSNTVEAFYGNVLRRITKGIPFIYVLDSLDSISADAEIERAKQYEEEKEKKKGSFKTEKPRMVSEMLRVIKGEISETDSLLSIVSQTRDNLGFGAIFTPKVRSGGKALKFYCSHEVWLAVGKKKKKSDLEIGADVMGKVSKNKLTGKKRDVVFPIYYDYGIDDVASCIDFLIERGIWKKKKNSQKILTNELFPEITMIKLIDTIEKENREKEIINMAGEAWTKREDSVKLKRKKKFA
jgi:recombination protein RecA